MNYTPATLLMFIYFALTGLVLLGIVAVPNVVLGLLALGTAAALLVYPVRPDGQR